MPVWRHEQDGKHNARVALLQGAKIAGIPLGRLPMQCRARKMGPRYANRLRGYTDRSNQSPAMMA